MTLPAWMTANGGAGATQAEESAPPAYPSGAPQQFDDANPVCFSIEINSYFPLSLYSFYSRYSIRKVRL